jgi:hypothetical protein
MRDVTTSKAAAGVERSSMSPTSNEAPGLGSERRATSIIAADPSMPR